MNDASGTIGAASAKEPTNADQKCGNDGVSLLLVSEDPAILAMAQRDIERSLTIPKTLKCATHLNEVWAAINEQAPDLIVLDSKGSGAMNAVELLAALRREPATAVLPLVFLAHSTKEAEETAAWPLVKTLIKPCGSLEFCSALETSLAVALNRANTPFPLWR